MSDCALIISVAELMVEKQVLTDFGLKMLNNDIESDMTWLNPDDNERITRTAIYFTIVYNLAIFFAGYCAETGDPRDQRMREIGAMVVDYIPKLLRGLDEKHLEVYHGAKVNAFTATETKLMKKNEMHENLLL